MCGSIQVIQYRRTIARVLIFLLLYLGGVQMSVAASSQAEIDALSKEIESKVISWRRDLHAHPELSYQEVRTAKQVADHLKRLNMEVKTGIAGTGVIGVLKGKSDSPVVALRADMDALPVKEATGLPFASKAKAQYEGRTVDVMHACGHDSHTSILMGAAEVLAKMRDKIPGTIKFIFQPAEEDLTGAEKMIKAGVLENPKPAAIFGLHVAPYPSHLIAARSGGAMASADVIKITVKGRQTHAALPWDGVDPVVVSSQIILGLQTIASRQTNLTRSPLVISIGQIHGGIRSNIIPDTVVMEGTLRTFDAEIREATKEKIKKLATTIAEASGATADVSISEVGCPVMYNDPKLFAQMEETLKRVSNNAYMDALLSTGTEDFAFYGQKIPSLLFFLGTAPPDAKELIPNHSPKFTVDESALIVGVRAMASLATDFLEKAKQHGE